MEIIFLCWKPVLPYLFINSLIIYHKFIYFIFYFIIFILNIELLFYKIYLLLQVTKDKIYSLVFLQNFRSAKTIMRGTNAKLSQYLLYRLIKLLSQILYIILYFFLIIYNFIYIYIYPVLIIIKIYSI